MKIDFTTTVLTCEGAPYIDQFQREMTLASASLEACSNPLPGDESLTPAEKLEIGKIGLCVSRNLPITSEQLAILKNRLAAGFVNPVLVAILHETVEGAIVAPAPKPLAKAKARK